MRPDDGVVDAFGVEITVGGAENIQCDQRAQRRWREALLLVVGEVRVGIAEPGSPPIRRSAGFCVIPALLPGGPIESLKRGQQDPCRDHPPGGALPGGSNLIEDLRRRPAVAGRVSDLRHQLRLNLVAGGKRRGQKIVHHPLVPVSSFRSALP